MITPRIHCGHNRCFREDPSACECDCADCRLARKSKAARRDGSHCWSGQCYARWCDCGLCETIVEVRCNCNCDDCKKAKEFKSLPDINGYGITEGQYLEELLATAHEIRYGTAIV